MADGSPASATSDLELEDLPTSAEQEEDPQKIAAREFGRAIGVRRREAGAPVRTIFVSDPSVERPPLARLLSGSTGAGGGGRGGQLRLKLYLSLIWVCAREPYSSQRPARSWAALLGLPDPAGRGTRRIQQALHDLQARGFVTLEERAGLPTVVTLLDESGNGAPYVPASEAYSQAQRNGAGPAVLAHHRYFRVDSGLWTRQYISKLKGPGLAMLLALLSERRGQDSPWVWFSPERGKERFGLSVSTRSDGLAQLRDLDLVRTKAQVISERGDYIEFQRRRNVHRVLL